MSLFRPRLGLLWSLEDDKSPPVLSDTESDDVSAFQSMIWLFEAPQKLGFNGGAWCPPPIIRWQPASIKHIYGSFFVHLYLSYCHIYSFPPLKANFNTKGLMWQISNCAESVHNPARKQWWIWQEDSQEKHQPVFNASVHVYDLLGWHPNAGPKNDGTLWSSATVNIHRTRNGSESNLLAVSSSDYYPCPEQASVLALHHKMHGLHL